MARNATKSLRHPGERLPPLPISHVNEFQLPMDMAVSLHDPYGKKHRNPFSMPPETEVFAYRDGELRQRKKERQEKRDSTKSLHERSTVSRTVAGRNRQVVEDISRRESQAEQGTDGAAQPSALELVAQTKDRRLDKERLAEFVAKKREMFLLQYSLNVKREEIVKLEKDARREERKLDHAERSLKEDNKCFELYMKQNDKRAVDAVKSAEEQTRKKLEKMAETKRTTSQIMALKSEISKNEEQLKTYTSYWKFLFQLAPADWRAEQNAKRAERRQAKWALHDQQHQKSSTSVASSSVGAASSVDLDEKKEEKKATTSHHSTKPPSSRVSGQSAKDHSAKKRQLQTPPSAGTTAEGSATSLIDDLPSELDSDEEAELFFTHPQELLEIFTKLEEQNLSLIQNSQETEEALEAIKHTRASTEELMNRELASLRRQITTLEDEILQEESKADDLQIKMKLFSHGEFQADEQETLLSALDTKVGEVYRRCIGDNEAGVSSLQMLTTIENRLEELFERIEVMPTERVHAAERSKERERRERVRQEKLDAQRQHQEERVRKALERARADPKKQTGRRLVFRSEPPQAKERKDDRSSAFDKEQEEMRYYFS